MSKCGRPVQVRIITFAVVLQFALRITSENDIFCCYSHTVFVTTKDFQTFTYKYLKPPCSKSVAELVLTKARVSQEGMHQRLTTQHKNNAINADDGLKH